MPDGSDREREIRELAWRLWRDAGSPDGREEEFWYAAEAELRTREDRSSDADDGSFPASDPRSDTGIMGPGR
ncbi:MAG TPA: DUF2934 domain-containing protein [Acidiphilium sp.]